MQTARRLLSVLLSVFLVSALWGCAGHGNDRQKNTGEYLDDSWITSKVKTAFVKDKTLSSSDINVETNQGAVQLSGFVNDPGDLSHAAEVASSVKGVTSVRNDLQVR